MTRERFDHLLVESQNERLSYGELLEINEEFDKIPADNLDDDPDNALADDMLREIEIHRSFD